MTHGDPTNFGKYKLLDRIAMGGMAELYRAMIHGDHGFEKLIAVKRLLPHLSDEENVVCSFIDEARLAALLQHRNVIQIYDFGSMEGRYFIAMEYLFGKDLHALVKKTRENNVGLGLENTLYIVTQICEGLEYAHTREDFQGNPLNIIHRDVSPQNIFINYGGEVKIIDFGIAKASSRSAKTQLDVIKGKVAYMSPEQAEGKRIDHRSDIFSTGILLYEMLTGSRMFNGDATEVFSQVREARFTPPEELVKDLPSELYDILHKALAKSPDLRYQTCGDMYEDLALCIQERSLHQSPPGISAFMRDLYSDDIVTEEIAIREATRAPHPAGQADTPEAKVRTIPKTIVMKPGGSLLGNLPRWAPLVGAGLFLVVPAAFLALLLAPATEKGEPPSIASDRVAIAQPPVSSVESPPGERQLFEKGLKALEEKNYGEAAVLFQSLWVSVGERIPELKASYEKALFQLGLAHVKTGEYVQAVQAYEKALQLNPSSVDTCFNLGYAYAMKRDYGQAETMYQHVVELAPFYLDEALFNLAMVQEKEGKMAECLLNLEQALQVNPDNQMVVKNLQRLKAEVDEK